jgi:chromate transport protein ChrA
MRLLASFVKVGAVCYGGGALSIPWLRQELVDKGVLSKKDFADGLALSGAVPGFILSNLAIFAGIRSTGAVAGVVAIVGAVVPTMLMMVAVTQLYLHYRDVPTVRAALQAIQPVSLGLLVVMIVRLAPTSLGSLTQVGTAVSATAAILAFKIHPGILLGAMAASSLLASAFRSDLAHKPAGGQPGTLYMAVKRLPRLADEDARCYVFVAIDSASCWTCMSVGRSNSPEAALGFVERLVAKIPFKVVTVVVGERATFASAGGLRVAGRGPEDDFAGACRSLGIDLRIAGADVPPPHLGIEQFNRRLRQVLRQQHLRPFAVAKQSLQRYAWLHNECLPQKTAFAATPSETLRQWRAIHPQIFTKHA